MGLVLCDGGAHIWWRWRNSLRCNTLGRHPEEYMLWCIGINPQAYYYSTLQTTRACHHILTWQYHSSWCETKLCRLTKRWYWRGDAISWLQSHRTNLGWIGKTTAASESSRKQYTRLIRDLVNMLLQSVLKDCFAVRTVAGGNPRFWHHGIPRCQQWLWTEHLGFHNCLIINVNTFWNGVCTMRMTDGVVIIHHLVQTTYRCVI